MFELCQFIRQSRLNAGMTQEEATFHLPVELRTLQGYERGERLPPLDLIVPMAELYRDPGLCIYALQSYPGAGELWSRLSSQAPLDLPLAACAAGMLETLDCLLRDHYRTILRIVRDNRINAEEAPEWAHILQLVRDAVAWLVALERFAPGMKPQDRGID